MRKFVAFATAAFIPVALACTCPASTASWWVQSKNVLVVRLESVSSERELFLSRERCIPSEPTCTEKQVARYTVIERIKGSNTGIPTLASGYGGGDCGIPLIAGAYYVVFLTKSSGSIGICNTAGPYLMRRPDEGAYPKRIDVFVNSLRKAARDPKATIAPRPEAARDW